MSEQPPKRITVANGALVLEVREGYQELFVELPTGWSTVGVDEAQELLAFLEEWYSETGSPRPD